MHLNLSRQAIIDRSFCSASSTSKYLQSTVCRAVQVLTATNVRECAKRGVGNSCAGGPQPHCLKTEAVHERQAC